MWIEIYWPYTQIVVSSSSSFLFCSVPKQIQCQCFYRKTAILVVLAVVVNSTLRQCSALVLGDFLGWNSELLWFLNLPLCTYNCPLQTKFYDFGKKIRFWSRKLVENVLNCNGATHRNFCGKICDLLKAATFPNIPLQPNQWGKWPRKSWSFYVKGTLYNTAKLSQPNVPVRSLLLHCVWHSKVLDFHPHIIQQNPLHTKKNFQSKSLLYFANFSAVFVD